MFSIIHPWLAVLGLVVGIVLGVVGMRAGYRSWLRLTGASVARTLALVAAWSAALVVVLWLEVAFLFEAYLRFPAVIAAASAVLVLVLTTLIVPFVPRGVHRPGWPSVRRALERAGATVDVARALSWGAWLPFVLSFLAVVYPVMVLTDFYNII